MQALKLDIVEGIRDEIGSKTSNIVDRRVG